MITVTARPHRPHRTRWIAAAVAVGGLAALTCVGVLAATHTAALAEAGAALGSMLGGGCARLSCVLDAGAEHAFLVGKIAASLGALVRTALALV